MQITHQLLVHIKIIATVQPPQPQQHRQCGAQHLCVHPDISLASATNHRCLWCIKQIHAPCGDEVEVHDGIITVISGFPSRARVNEPSKYLSSYLLKEPKSGSSGTSDTEGAEFLFGGLVPNFLLALRIWSAYAFVMARPILPNANSFGVGAVYEWP